MPKFSDEFLRSINNSMLTQSVQGVAYKAGAAPGVIKRREEQERRDKGILGGTLAAQQMANEGMFTPKVARDFVGSLQGLGVPPNQILEQTAQLQQLNQKQAAKNSVASAFQQWLTDNNIDPEISEDVKRGINAGTITTAQGAIDLAVTNSQKAFKRDYFANLADYDSGIGTLVQRGNYEAAEQRFLGLQAKLEQEPANEYLAKFQDEGSEITATNRGEVWKSVVATTEDLNEATTVMARLEKNSVDLRAAKHKGPTRQITYIPKAETEEQMAVYSFGDTGKVSTKQINAPIDPATGKIDAKWMQDFIKYSAERVIGRGELTPSKNDDDDNDGYTPPPGEGTLGQLAPGLVDSLVNAEMEE